MNNKYKNSSKVKVLLLLASSMFLAGCGGGNNSSSTSSSSNEESSSSSSQESSNSYSSSSSSSSNSSSSSSSVSKHTVTWINEDGTILLTDTDVLEGEDPAYTGATPTKEQDADNVYSFDGWDKSADSSTGNVTYTAKYVASKKLAFSYDADSASYTLTQALKASTSVNIPDTYNDGTNGSHPVTTIGAETFKDCVSLISITIPDNITLVDFTAFDGCTGLTTISLGKGFSLNEIPSDGEGHYTYPEKYFLTDCSKLSSISVSKDNANYYSVNNCLVSKSWKAIMRGCSNSTIPANSDIQNIYYEAFANCASLESITIPNNIGTIYARAFEGCSSLTSVSIGSGLSGVQGSSFASCPKLVSFSINSANSHLSVAGNCIIDSSGYVMCASDTFDLSAAGITGISDNGLSGATKVSSIAIPVNIVSISKRAFYGCEALTSLSVTTGNSKYSSSNNCIIDTSSKQIVAGCEGSSIPSDSSLVTGIETGAFAGVASFKDLEIPSNILSIGSSAFEACPNLTSLMVGDSLKTIENGAFEDCHKLETVTIGSGLSSIEYTSFKGDENLTSFTLKSNTHYKVMDSCLVEGNSIIASLGKGKSITSDSSVTTIERYVFEDREDLTSIDIPDNIETLESYVFEDCSNLTSVSIGKGLSSFDGDSFWGCSSLSHFEVDESNVNYKVSTDSSCIINAAGSELIIGGCVATIPSSVTTINESAFPRMSNLKNIVIPSGVTTISDYAFDGCSSLSSISFPDSVTTIGKFAFFGCGSLKSVTFGSGLSSVGDRAFVDYDSNQITTIKVSSSNTKYSSEGNCLYDYVNKIVVVSSSNTVIPSDAITIGQYAFQSSSVASVTIPSSVTTIKADSFSDCHYLSSIIIPKMVTTIEMNAFYDCYNTSIYLEATSDVYTAFWNAYVKATYLYSEDVNNDGTHWHYVNDIPTVYPKA